MADSALIFDTHEDIQELVNSGMPEPQAETVVRQRLRLLERNLATKADIAATNATLRQETKADIGEETKAIEALRQETKADRYAAAGDRETDSPRQERHHQVGCRRQSRDRRHDRRRVQTPLIPLRHQ